MSLCHQELEEMYRKELRLRRRSGSAPVTLSVNYSPAGAIVFELPQGGLSLEPGDLVRACAAACHGQVPQGRDECPLLLKARGAMPSEESKEGCNGGCKGSGAGLGAPDLVLIRHSLSLLPHSQALCLLNTLRRKTRVGGKIFISTFGLHSHLGDAYALRYRPLGERFAPVHARKGLEPLHNVSICLYSEREFFATLLQSGWGVQRTATSTDGNVLAVGVRI